MKENLNELFREIKAVCPIHRIRADKEWDKSTWVIEFKDSATPEQRVLAQGVLDRFSLKSRDQINANHKALVERLSDFDTNEARNVDDLKSFLTDLKNLVLDR